MPRAARTARTLHSLQVGTQTVRRRTRPRLLVRSVERGAVTRVVQHKVAAKETSPGSWFLGWVSKL
jgi:hypothetical protein